MKQTIFTLLLLSTLGLLSCRKDKIQQNITQYDASQIQSYIQANHITGMLKDTVGGDTSGIYYKILTQPGPNDTAITYTSKISFVFSLRTFDGKYSSFDTIANHYFGYVGEITADALPYGLELAIANDLKKGGGSMRILIPSNLAYGLSGYGSGSASVTNTHIAGNQCLDYYVHIIDNQPAYDKLVIKNYMTANSLTGYTPDTGIYSGLYYKIAVQGTGTDSITNNSTVTISREGRLLNGTIFDETYNSLSDTIAVQVPNLPPGVQAGLKMVTTGATISMIMTSALGFQPFASLPVNVPPNSCIRYEYEVRRVSP